jgi:hypothetical protein
LAVGGEGGRLDIEVWLRQAEQRKKKSKAANKQIKRR